MSQQQPTWEMVRNAVQAAIVSASGFSSTSVIWSGQNANAPAYPYIRLALGNALTVGNDWISEWIAPDWEASTVYAANDRVLNDGGRNYVCITSGTSAGGGSGPTGTGSGITDGSVVWDYVAPGSEIGLTTAGTREVVMTIECFTNTAAPSSGAVPSSTDSRAILEAVKSRLRLPTTRGGLGAVGFVPFDPGTINVIPDVVSVGFRGRSVLDVRCYMPARAYTEYTTWIQSYSGTATITGAAGGTITQPIAYP